MPKQQQMAAAMTQLAIDITQGLRAGFLIQSLSTGCEEWKILIFLLQMLLLWIKGGYKILWNFIWNMV